MELSVNLSESSSRIIIERNAISHLSKYMDLNRKVMIISDEGVPEEYQQLVLSQCPNGQLFITEQGEGAKSMRVYQQICMKLLEMNFSRHDMILALGGGVIGDLSGFVAATFKRGIHFSSIPTTTLSQIDSSIGGKVAINLDEVKNVLGTFYHPEVVIVDLTTLKTLPRRHYYNGLAEAVKEGLIADPELFELFEKHDANFQNNEPDEILEEIITRSLIVKKKVVEEDEKEANLRKILNFGHTIGHAIESLYHLHDYYHGECVSIGMMKIIENKEIKQRLEKVLTKMNLPIDAAYNPDEVIRLIFNDKKADGKKVTVVQVNEIGHAELSDVDIETLRNYL